MTTEPEERRVRRALSRLENDLPTVSDQELGELARRARRSQPASRLPVGRLAGVLAILAVAAAVVPAVRLGDDLLSRTARAQPALGSWSWPELVPGNAFAADAAARSAARSSLVLPGRIREVVSAGASPETLALLAAATGDGHICFAARTARAIGPFHCVDRFAQAPLIRFLRRPHPGRLLIVGVARSDVGSVRLVEPGRARELPLNRWRGFAYAGEDAGGRISIVPRWDGDAQSFVGLVAPVTCAALGRGCIPPAA